MSAAPDWTLLCGFPSSPYESHNTCMHSAHQSSTCFSILLPLFHSSTSHIAMSTLNTEDPHIPDQLVDQLTKGYDALASELKRVHEHSLHLENKLAWAKQQASLIFIAYFLLLLLP
jgi:hypothetical protein